MKGGDTFAGVFAVAINESREDAITHENEVARHEPVIILLL